MTKKQMSIAQIKNLPQYRGLNEEELEKVLYKIHHGDAIERADGIIERFEIDYDLSEMTANDKLSLLELARIFVMLEDIEASLQEELNSDNTDWTNFERINRVSSKLREDASRFQRDLNITRKARQDTGGQSVVDFIEDIKKRATKFLDKSLSRIYCPKCKMLLAKTWLLYPNESNEFRLVCGRKGCGYSFKVLPSTFIDGRNIEAGPPK